MVQRCASVPGTSLLKRFHQAMLGGVSCCIPGALWSLRGLLLWTLGLPSLAGSKRSVVALGVAGSLGFSCRNVQPTEQRGPLQTEAAEGHAALAGV